MTPEEKMEYAHSREGVQAARDYLSAALRMDNLIAVRLSRLDQLRSRGKSISLILDSVHSGSVSDRVGDTAAELADQEEALLRDYRELLRLQREIGDVIAAVPWDEPRMILELRYLQGLSPVAISMKLHYDERQVYRLHRKGLEHVAFQLVDRGKIDCCGEDQAHEGERLSR